MRKYFLFVVLLFVMMSCVVKRTIIEKPILFDAEREQLTLDYLKDRYGLETSSTTIQPKIIVLHWTVIPTLEASYKAFYDSKLPNWRPDLENVSELNVSSQFLIDQDGVIYQLMPETTMARHVIGLNHCAIGVENVGGSEDLPLTRKQLKANVWLVKYLKEKYDIDYVIGHYEYTNFEGHELWLEKDTAYRTEKTDPGERFMKRVRRATKKIDFKPVPEN